MQTLPRETQLFTEPLSELQANESHVIALSRGSELLTYKELNRRANKFAEHLESLGVLSGGSVAICMERSFDCIIAALGIMRAGAAYVPLDIAWPDSRLDFALSDSGAVVVVGRQATLDRLQVKIPSVDPLRDAAVIEACSGRPPKFLHPKNLAYLIYTSGSTGVPKGVEITHANLNHLVDWHRSAFSVNSGDRVSHLAGLGFDAAVWELWPNLCAGATVCLADDEVRSSPERIKEWMVRERITIGFVPTVHAAPMMAMKWPKETALRFLLTGGEALHHSPPADLPFEVVNNYGPTECTVVATYSVLKPQAQGVPSIGSAINGACVYLLDDQGGQVSDGVTGEIYVGGNGVARGYRNLAEVTSRSFLHDPFAGTPGARMYRTGDQGSRNANGEIEFRGRLDRQTKIRGHRIELDEIGATLEHHPHVAFATVIAKVSESGENRLIAYVLPKFEAMTPASQELQEFLLKDLPGYMVPAIFLRLTERPLSANGKIDLTILADLPALPLLDKPVAKAPATEVEGKLLAIMQELLEDNTVTAEDNFFLAGGHSLLGMQLVMRLESAFGVDVSLRQLFEAPTVERLAPIVETMHAERRLEKIWKELLGKKQIGLDDDFYLSGGNDGLTESLRRKIAAEFGQNISLERLLQNTTIRKQAALTHQFVEVESELPEGVLALQPNGVKTRFFWCHYLTLNLAKVIGDEQPFYSVVLTNRDFEMLGEAPTLEAIAGRFVDKIRATQPEGPYYIGGFCVGGVLAFEIAHQLHVAKQDVPLLVMLDTPNPSYLEDKHPLSPRLSQPRYLMKRAARLGPRKLLAKLRYRVQKHIAGPAEANSDNTEMDIAQDMIEAAASIYQAPMYDGKTLLMLAADHPPHINFVPGWQAVSSGDLHIQHMEGHHSDLIDPLNVQRVADSITFHLASTVSK